LIGWKSKWTLKASGMSFGGSGGGDGVNGGRKEDEEFLHILVTTITPHTPTFITHSHCHIHSPGGAWAGHYWQV